MATHRRDDKVNIAKWGNGLAVRLNKTITETAGVTKGSPVYIHAERGRIIIETAKRRPTLNELLAAFDPDQHGGEMMALPLLGVERIE